MGMDTWHAMANCNNREIHDLRVAFSVYLADVNNDSVELLAKDDTVLFPIP